MTSLNQSSSPDDHPAFIKTRKESKQPIQNVVLTAEHCLSTDYNKGDNSPSRTELNIVSIMFPVEVWEQILKHSDITDFANFRRVCKTWNDIMDRVCKETYNWNKACQNAIPKCMQSSIFQKLYPEIDWTDFSVSRINSKKWMTVYRCWAKWHGIIENNDETMEQLRIINNPLEAIKQITCVRISGNILAMGTAEGDIIFYDFNNLGQAMFVVDQMDYVRDIQFFSTENGIMAVSCSTSCKVRFWDMQFKKMIVDPFDGNVISTSGRYCCIGFTNCLLVIRTVMRNGNEILQADLTTLPAEQLIVALVADGDKVLVWTAQRILFTINLCYLKKDGKFKTMDAVRQPNIRPNIVNESPKQRIRQHYMFRPHIALCITEHSYLGCCVSTGNWRMYNIFQKLHGVPTAVLFYAQLLILGLDSGEVHIYHVKNVNCLEDFDFTTENSKKITLDPEAIISLDILEHPTNQYLLAASESCVSIIKFN